MNPLKFLKRLVSTEVEVKDTLATLAVMPERRNEFLALLMNSQVVMVSLGTILDEEGLDDKKLMQHIEHNAKQLAAIKNADQVKPYTYNQGENHILPIFSSQERFTKFMERDERPLECLHAFYGIGVNFDYLLNDEFSTFTLMLNPTHHTETCISDVERQKMRIVILQQASDTQKK